MGNPVKLSAHSATLAIVGRSVSWLAGVVVLAMTGCAGRPIDSSACVSSSGDCQVAYYDYLIDATFWTPEGRFTLVSPGVRSDGPVDVDSFLDMEIDGAAPRSIGSVATWDASDLNHIKVSLVARFGSEERQLSAVGRAYFTH